MWDPFGSKKKKECGGNNGSGFGGGDVGDQLWATNGFKVLVLGYGQEWVLGQGQERGEDNDFYFLVNYFYLEKSTIL